MNELFYFDAQSVVDEDLDDEMSGGGSIETFHILTEAGDPLTTEAGDRLRTE
jgi:hypothetical protein